MKIIQVCTNKEKLSLLVFFYRLSNDWYFIHGQSAIAKYLCVSRTVPVGGGIVSSVNKSNIQML